MRLRSSFRSGSLVFLVLLAGCGLTTEDPDGTGGRLGPGGEVAAGGTPATGGAPATGGVGTGGDVGGTGGCPALPVECSPGGEVCDPRTGRRATCDSCGQVVPVAGSEECVRALAMDQESNVACAIVGANRLVCFGPDGSGVRETSIPEGTRTIVMPDDAANLPWQPLEQQTLCFLGFDGSLRCSGSRSSIEWNGCSDAALSDQGPFFLCAMCEGALRCDGVDAPPSDVSDFAMGDGVLYVLKEGRVFFGGMAAARLSGDLVTISRSDRDDLCGLTADGGVLCSLSTEPATRGWEASFVEASTGPDGFVCGLTSTFDASCAFLPPSGEPTTLSVSLSDQRTVKTSFGVVCSLSLDGRVRCFSSTGEELWVPVSVQ